ncbi:MAG: hypothetical protein ABIO86_17155 [Sphingomonas sp.]
MSPTTDAKGKLTGRCVGLLCHLGAVTGSRCESESKCPLKVLEGRGIIAFVEVKR